MHRVVALWLLLPATARAAEPAIQPPVAPAASEEWYGWQTLAADGAVAASWITAHYTSSTTSTTFGVLGAMVYVAGAPVIHGMHGRPAVGLSSLLLRTTLPFVAALGGALIGSSFCAAPTNHDDFEVSSCTASGAQVALFGTMVALSILDAGRGTITPGATEWHMHREPPIAFVPAITPTSTGASIGLVGRF